MTDYANTIKRLRCQGDGFVVSSVVADEMEALIRERDEARSKAIDDALVRCDMEIHNGPFPFDAARREAHQWTAKAIRSAIAELKEETRQNGS